MLKLWKASTVALVVQLVVGGIVYAATGDLARALGAAFAAAFALGAVLAPAPALAAAAAVIALAFAAVLAPAFADAVSFANIAAIPAAILAVIFAGTAASEVTSESAFWQRLICALPLGIGTVFGGLLILAARRKEVRS